MSMQDMRYTKATQDFYSNGSLFCQYLTTEVDPNYLQIEHGN